MNYEQTTLARSNYHRLAEAGLMPERAYPEADLWAYHRVTVLGHEYTGGRLFIDLQGPEGNNYRRELHLARSAA